MWPSLLRLAPLTWPLYIGQLAVLAFSTVDTLMLARHGALDLAALAVGVSAYITVFIGFMGVVLAIGPIAGRLFGAKQHAAAGRQVHQMVWLIVGLSVLGSALLLFPQPFLALSQAGPEMAPKVQGYLQALAFSLPASLLFTLFRSFSNAVSRPRVVMALQLMGLAVKIPLTALLVFGWPAGGLPALGAVGCGIATAIVMWSQLLLALWLLRRDPFYAPFALFGRGLDKPDGPALKAQLKLGLPIGATTLVEVTGFSFMALFLARLGTTTLAGHQVMVNVVAMLFMFPLALGNAASALVAQRIGAGDVRDAARLGWHAVAWGGIMGALMGGAAMLLREPILGWYGVDAAVAAIALPLLAYLAFFHISDALQAVSGCVLRAWQVTTAPFVINTLTIWGLGLGLGYLFGFEVLGPGPAWLRGASGFWLAQALSLAVSAAALIALLVWVLRRQGLWRLGAQAAQAAQGAQGALPAAAPAAAPPPAG